MAGRQPFKRIFAVFGSMKGVQVSHMLSSNSCKKNTPKQLHVSDVDRVLEIPSSRNSNFLVAPKILWHTQVNMSQNSPVQTLIPLPPLLLPVKPIYKQSTQAMSPWKSKYLWDNDCPDSCNGRFYTQWPDEHESLFQEMQRKYHEVARDVQLETSQLQGIRFLHRDQWRDRSV